MLSPLRSYNKILFLLFSLVFVQQLCAGPIHDAAKVGDSERVKLLIASGVDVNSRDKDRWTPLHQSAFNGRKTIVKLLLGAGANIEAQDSARRTPIHSASYSDKGAGVVKLLLDAGANPDAGANKDAQSNRKRTPLLDAAMHGCTTIVKLLLDAGANKDYQGSSGWTPLHRAVSSRRTEVVKLLLNAGANIKLKNNKNQTPLDMARERKRTEIIKLLTPLKNIHEAVRAGRLWEVKRFIDQGQNIEIKDHQGNSALMMAVQHGHIDIVYFLLEKGASRSLKNNKNQTPLDIAREKNHTEIIALLRSTTRSLRAMFEGKLREIQKVKVSKRRLITGFAPFGPTVGASTTPTATLSSEKSATKTIFDAVKAGSLEEVKRHLRTGVDIDIRYKGNRYSLLHVAAGAGQLELVRFLIDSGLDKDLQDNHYQSTPLHQAAYNGHHELVKFLLSKGVKLNVGNNFASRPLHHAADHGHVEVAKLLLSYGANPNVTDSDKKTPLDRAKQRNHTEIIKLLTPSKNIHEAARDGKLWEVKKFVTQGVNVNAVDDNKRTPLHQAAWKGYASIAKLLIEAGGNKDARSKYKETPLHWAAGYGHDEVVKFLLDLGADANALDYNNSTPLDWAAQFGRTEVGKLLLVGGTDITQKNNKNQTALDIAREKNHTEMIELLENTAGKRALNQPTATVQTTPIKTISITSTPSSSSTLNVDINAILSKFSSLPAVFVHPKNQQELRSKLLAAACGGNLEHLKRLIAWGGNKNHADKEGRTLLQWATRNGHFDTVRYLLELEVDIDKQNKWKDTALGYAIRTQDPFHPTHAEIIKLLVQYGADIQFKCGGQTYIQRDAAKTFKDLYSLLTPSKDIHEAARDGKLWEVKRFAKQEGNIEAKGEQGCTPLHFAVQKRHRKIVEVLLELGANIDAETNAQWTPLNLAFHYGYFKIAQFLIEKGADTNIANHANQSPLHLAVTYGQVQLVQLLLANGAKIESKNNDGYTPLILAAEKGNKEIVKMLIDKGALIEAKNEGGYTPLLGAAHFAHNEIVKLLLVQGANIEAKNKGGSTPLCEAAYLGNNETVKLLIEYGADTAAKINDGRSALQLAQEKGHTAVVNLLKEYPTTISYAFEFAKTGNILNLQEAFDKGMFVNVRDKFGKNLLHWAASKGHADMVKYLIEQGVALDAKDKDGDMPYHLALRISNHTPTIKHLIRAMKDQGISLKLNDGKGYTPLYRAAEHKNFEIFEILKAEKVPGWPNPNSKTASVILQEAEGKLPVVKAPVSTPIATKDFIIDYKDLTLGQKIGRGGFGDVFKGTWTGQDVAVKKLHMADMSAKCTQEFERETKVWSKLHHPNIIALLGICISPNPYCMVMKYKPSGSLYKLLQSKQDIPWSSRKQMAVDIASALLYLHKKNIVHRDLKSLNILVGKEEGQLRASLTDFGLSEVKQETASTTKIGAQQSSGTLLWMAPELLKGRKCTKASDIYAYGMVLWELATRKVPFNEVHQSAVRGLIKESELSCLKIPTETPESFSGLIKQCWSKQPTIRPSAKSTLDQLLGKLPKNNPMVTGDLDTVLIGDVSPIKVAKLIDSTSSLGKRTSLKIKKKIKELKKLFNKIYTDDLELQEDDVALKDERMNYINSLYGKKKLTSSEKQIFIEQKEELIGELESDDEDVVAYKSMLKS